MCMYALNIKGLIAGSVHALNRGYVLNNGVHQPESSVVNCSVEIY